MLLVLTSLKDKSDLYLKSHYIQSQLKTITIHDQKYHFSSCEAAMRAKIFFTLLFPRGSLKTNDFTV